MKSFLKNLFGKILTGLILWVVFTIISLVFFSMFISGLSSKNVEVPEQAMLVLDMNVILRDKPTEDDLLLAMERLVTGDDIPRLGLWEALRAIDSAALDNRIAGIVMVGSLIPDSLGGGYAAISELRATIENFKSSGKPVFAYLENNSLKDYYLATVADQVWLHPMAVVSLQGIASEGVYWGDALDQWGIDIQPLKAGIYKSAIEPFTENQMSPAAKAQRSLLINDLWQVIIQRIAVARSLDLDRIVEISNSMGLVDAQKSLEFSLVDKLFYKDEMLAEVIKVGKKNENNHSFEQVSLLNYASLVKQTKQTEPTLEMTNDHLAIVYAEGTIVDGESEGDNLGGDSLSRQLRQLRQDDEVKAVVLRVNSPGGSAYASELIRREMELIAQSKTLVVSMGHLAASGGYWISLPAETIFAEAQTITGSIGVFGLLPNVKELAEKYSIYFDGVQTGPYADIFSISKPATEQQMNLLQGHVDSLYDQFTGLVAEARGLPLNRMSDIAEGRVWTGFRAKELGLVDEVGGLISAVNYTWKVAKLGEGTKIIEYPKKKDPAEMISELLSGGARTIYQAKTPSPLEKIKRTSVRELQFWESLRDPNHIYARLKLEIE